MAQKHSNFETLKAALSSAYTVSQLKSLGSKISTNLPTRKAELVDHINSTVFRNLKEIVKKLDQLGIAALKEAVFNWNGEFRSKQFTAKYGAYPITSTSDDPYRKDLHLLFLFFITGGIPTDLQEILKTILHQPETESIQYSSQEDLKGLNIRETELAAAMNLNMMIDMLNDGQLKVSGKSGRPTAAVMKKINAALYDGDFYEDEDYGPFQAFAWPVLLQGGGIAELDGITLKLTRKGTAVAKKGLAECIKTIWKKWEKTTIIDEFSRVKHIKGQKAAKGRALLSPVRRRPAINNVLSHLKKEQWVSVDELARYMLSGNLDFDMTNYAWKLYILDPHYGSLDYCDTWPLLQLRYMLVYFFEYCATLGILDVAYKNPEYARTDFRKAWGADEYEYLSVYDGLMHIRLTRLGAYVLGLSEQYRSKDGESFCIVDTLIQYEGSGMPPADTLLYLDKIADQKEASQWQISESTLAMAVKNGEKIADIKAFLNGITSGNPGKMVSKLLDEMMDMAAGVVDKGAATLYECHPQARKQIISDQRLNSLCLPAGDVHIVVLPGKKKAFLSQLEALGIIVER
ncbi:hypothetical protein [uncultured Desulfobacter sp.]|uniref:hypothetical protein n=1 Tax=uncultured Desulfobacter sp. TaxID=240139 RepID=UPI002AAA9671|nr:hypothetical protein [uncultured Desulfobacter sp.]